jgi:hypothetical protein
VERELEDQELWSKKTMEVIKTRRRIRRGKAEKRLFKIWYPSVLKTYPYFDVVVGPVWSHDPKSYAGGGVCYW